MSRVLVYQANGIQGGAVLNFAQQAGFTVRALVRNIDKAAPLKERGFEVVGADLLDKQSLIKAHESVDFVIAQIPAYSDSFAARAIHNSISAMRQHGIKGAVLKMASPTPGIHSKDTGFSVNSIVNSEMGASGIQFAVVEPTMYLDTFLKPNLRNEICTLGVIDLPIDDDLEIAWTCVDDAAWLSVSLLEAQAFGLTTRCAGKHSYRGADLAEIFTSVLEKKITFKSTEVDEFQEEIEAAIGVENAGPVVSKFRFLAQHSEEASRMLGSLKENKWFIRPTSVRDCIEGRKQEFMRAG